MDIYESLNPQFSHVENMTIKSKKLLRDYTTSLYGELNAKLRDKESLSNYESIVNEIDELFLNVPMTEKSFVVYRGMDSHNFDIEKISYISTSHDINVAYNSYGDQACLLNITVKPGAKVLPIEKISEFRKEKEILLSRFGKFIIDNEYYEENDDYKDGVLVYDLIYVGLYENIL